MSVYYETEQLERLKSVAVPFKASTRKPKGVNTPYNYNVYLYMTEFFNEFGHQGGYIFWYIINALINEYYARITNVQMRYIDYEKTQTRYSVVEIDATTRYSKDNRDIKALYYVYVNDDPAQWVGVVSDWGKVGEIYLSLGTNISISRSNLWVLNTLTTFNYLEGYYFVDYLNKNRTYNLTLLEALEQYAWERL